jgi:hypothetical protein
VIQLELARLSDEDLEARYAAALAELGIETEEDAHRILDLETADLIEELSRIEVEHPLAAAVLWQRPDAPWDQQRMVASFVHSLTLVLGGNRSGKTYGVLEAAVAFALGGDHPAVACWLEDNDLPRDLVPLGPGEVYLAAPTAALSIKIHRLDLGAMLPGAVHWRGMHALTEASVEIAVPGHETPGRIWFKSVDQGHRAFKGDQVRFVGISEEPEGEEGELILAECMRACAATGGRVVLECTLQNGFTWVWDRLVEEGKYNPRVVELDSRHNTLVQDYASLTRWLASLTPEERLTRQLGRPVAREGLVYPGWSRGTGDRWGPGHLCDPFPIPPEWPRFVGADFGLSNPTVVVWIAVGDDDTHYLYRVYYGFGLPSYPAHAEQIAKVDVDPTTGEREVLEGGWGDPSCPEGIAALAEVGIYLAGANNDVETGISRCGDRLRVRGDGRPRFKVFSDQVEFVKEIENYRRNPKRTDGQPIKKKDHVMDAWRYDEAGIAEWSSL